MRALRREDRCLFKERGCQHVAHDGQALPDVVEAIRGKSSCKRWAPEAGSEEGKWARFAATTRKVECRPITTSTDLVP